MTSNLRFAAPFCLLPLLYACAPVAAELGQELGLALASERQSYHQGEPLAFRVSFHHLGERQFYLERPSSYGREGLDLVARRGDCEYAISPLHFDRPVEDLEALLTSLFPGDQLSVGSIELNFLDGFGDFVLPTPQSGDYSVVASFTSAGPTRVDGRRVWRGMVSSEPVSIAILPPERVEVDRWLARLSTCAEAASCADEQAIEYFTFVRDPAAPGLLRRVLERDVQQYRAAAALFHQGRVDDAGFLNRLGGGATYYHELADRLRNQAGTPCF